ncbi:MAG: TonB-dependent siderophore receptor [Burkholderiaceae bacterium]
MHSFAPFAAFSEHRRAPHYLITAVLLAGVGPVAWAQTTAPAAPSSPAAADGSATTNRPPPSLGEVTIRAQAVRPGEPPAPYAGGQVARGGRLGLLGDTDVMNTPFSQTSYTVQLIEDQQAATIGDVLDNAPSVRRSVPSYNIGEQFNVRGFGVSDTQTAINGLYGLVSSYGGTPPIEVAERVELLLGPSSLLNGMAPLGGTVNIVTKRAGDEPLTRLTLGLESDSLWKAHVDVGRRFGANGEWGVRFNGSRRSGDTTLDGMSRKDDLGALALDYRGERLRVALDVWRSLVRNRGGTPMIPGFSSTLTSLPRAPRGDVNVAPTNDYDATNTSAMLSGEFDITRDWTAYARAGMRRNDFAGEAQVISGVQADGTGVLTLLNTRPDNRARALELGLRGSFQTGAVKHTLSVSGTRQTAENRQEFVYAFGMTNIYDPPPIANRPAQAGDPPKTSETTLTGLTLADTLSMLDERLLLTLGVRRQNIRSENFNANLGGLATVTSSYDASAWTPMAGLVIKPREDLSLYANYIQGLSQGTTVGSTYQNAGEVFSPYKTRQIEAGAKLQTGSFTNTLSLFQITRPTTLSDTSTSPLPTLRLGGEQRNRGIEWSIFGALSPGVRVLGGVTYIQAELTRTQGGAQDGHDAPGTAPLAANLGTEWDVPGLPGLTLSGRLIHTGAQYLDNANTLKAPSWTRLDLGARYATRVAGKPVVLRASVRNAADRRYWEGVYMSGYVSPGAPRTFLVSASVDF